MPIRLRDRRRFTWQTTDDGLPLTPVVSYGGVAYTPTCALCGCFHQLIGVSFATVGDERTVKPGCLLVRWNRQDRTPPHLKLAYNDWLAQYPDAAQHDQVRAVYLGAGADVIGYKDSPLAAPLLVNKARPEKKPVYPEKLQSPASKRQSKREAA